MLIESIGCAKHSGVLLRFKNGTDKVKVEIRVVLFYAEMLRIYSLFQCSHAHCGVLLEIE